MALQALLFLTAGGYVYFAKPTPEDLEVSGWFDFFLGIVLILISIGVAWYSHYRDRLNGWLSAIRWFGVLVVMVILLALAAAVLGGLLGVLGVGIASLSST